MKFIDKNKMAIYLLSTLTVLATDSFAPLIQQVGLSYPDVSEPLLKQLVILPSMISMVFGLIAGQTVRLFNKRGIIITGLIMFSIGGIGAFWIPNFGVHMLLRSILGAGIGLVTPTSLSLIGDTYGGEERAGMIGNYLAFSKVFAILVPPAAALLAVNHWQNVYYLYFISVGILIYTLFALKPQQASEKNPVLEKPKNKIPPESFLLALAQFVLFAVFFVLITDLSFLISAKNSHSTVLSGFGLSMATIGTTVAGLFFQKTYRKVTKWIVPIGLIVMSAGFLIVTHSMMTSVILTGLFLAGFGVGLLISMINLSMTNAVGDSDGTAAMSVITCAQSLGVFVSPFLFGWNPIRFGNLSFVETNFQTAGLIFLILGLISLIFVMYQWAGKLRGTKPKDRPSLPESGE